MAPEDRSLTHTLAAYRLMVTLHSSLATLQCASYWSVSQRPRLIKIWPDTRNSANSTSTWPLTLLTQNTPHRWPTNFSPHRIGVLDWERPREFSWVYCMVLRVLSVLIQSVDDFMFNEGEGSVSVKFLWVQWIRMSKRVEMLFTSWIYGELFHFLLLQLIVDTSEIRKKKRWSQDGLHIIAIQLVMIRSL
jgi:hypothetical protein